MNEAALREQFVQLGHSLFMRGYSPGSSGNISARLSDGFLMSPTDSAMGFLTADRISKLDPDGRHIGGDPPSKEVVVHRAMYRRRPDAGAVVHLHSPACMAVSCLDGLDPENALPPLTPYFIMKIGRLPLLPYFRPGDPALADAVGDAAADHRALLLAHHGMIIAGKDLFAAVCAAEELEETARLFLAVKDRPHNLLTDAQIRELHEAFPK